MSNAKDFNARKAIESMDAQLDQYELVIESNTKQIEELKKANEDLINMLNKMSSALGLPKSLIPKLREAG